MKDVSLLRRLILPAAISLVAPPRGSASSELRTALPAQSYTSQVVSGVTPVDSRQYAFLTLKSGVCGLVVYDESYSRCDLAATVACGSLDDPPDREGLAHLAEHITIANDPANFCGFMEEREGDINGFTGERSTTFYGNFELVRRLSRAPSAQLAEVAAMAAYKQDVAEGCNRFAALFGRGEPCSAKLIMQEVGRVDAEMDDIAARPSRALVEVAALKARAAQESVWSRLGRGDATTLPASSTMQATRLCKQVEDFREGNYIPEQIRFAVVTPLPLSETVPLVAEAFGRVRPQRRARDGVPTAGGSADGGPSAPFPDLGRVLGGAMALVRPGRLTTLTLAWEVLVDDPLIELRAKPLDLIGHVLTEPQAHSLSATLRSRGLVPQSIELDSILRAKTIARADDWVIWQLEVILAEGAEARWREAAAIIQTAISQLAQRGVPRSAASEAQAISAAAWRFSSRPPTALELAADLQLETLPALSVLGPRAFVGDAAELCREADAVAAQLAGRTPLVTLWTADAAPLGVKKAGYSPPLPRPLGERLTLVPLEANAEKIALGSAPAVDWRPPAANAWVPTSFEKPAVPMSAVGYRFGVTGGREQDATGLGVLQLPDCIERRTLKRLPGSRAALEAAMCLRNRAPAAQRPLAVITLQLFSSRPAAATPRAAAQAELWRLTLLQAFSEQSARAARGGLKCDVSFNTRGMRLLVSGYAQRAPRFFILLLRRTLRHLATSMSAPELAASRRAAAAALNARGKPAAEALDEIMRGRPEQMQAEIARLFGSTTGASLLIAGTVGAEAADALATAVRTELAPLLPSTKLPVADATELFEPISSIDEELQRWTGLLYKPLFSDALAQNACLDPAIARALDQCGGI